MGLAGRGTRFRRVIYFVTGIVIPAVCIISALCGVDATVDQPWQSGRVVDYVAMLLRNPALLPLLPPVLYSMASLAVWLIKPPLERGALVRLGIYTGVLVAAQFLVLVLVVSGLTSPIFTLFGAPLLFLVLFVARWCLLNAKRFTIMHLFGLTTLCAVGTVALQAIDWSPWAIVMWFYIGCLACGPTLTLVAYLWAAVEIGWNARQLLPGSLGWLLVWSIGWKVAIERMFIEYATLPTTDPNCYVSSAAAHGHPWLVGTQLECEGQVVNMQMRRLKFLEFVLRAASPSCHQAVRRVYDGVGPWMAAVAATSVWFADVTYLALKPLEWIAILLSSCLRISNAKIATIYGPVSRREQFVESHTDIVTAAASHRTGAGCPSHGELAALQAADPSLIASSSI